GKSLSIPARSRPQLLPWGVIEAPVLPSLIAAIVKWIGPPPGRFRQHGQKFAVRTIGLCGDFVQTLGFPIWPISRVRLVTEEWRELVEFFLTLHPPVGQLCGGCESALAFRVF